MVIVGNILEEIEKDKNIRIPLAFLNTKGLKVLDEALDSGNPVKVHKFFKNFKEYYNLNSLSIISNELKRRRKTSDTDKKLIEELVSVKHNSVGIFLEVSGNLYYLSTLLEQLNKTKPLKRIIRISVLLWAYLNMVEIINKYLAEFINDYIRIKKITQDSYIKKYMKKFKPNMYPELGTNINMMVHLGMLGSKSNSMFNNNHFIRNKLSHANMYYDPYNKGIYLSSGEEYPFKQFKKDFKDLLEFLNELIFQMNNNNHKLEKTIDEVLSKTSNLFLRIYRSGILKKRYMQVICEWKTKSK